MNTALLLAVLLYHAPEDDMVEAKRNAEARQRMVMGAAGSQEAGSPDQQKRAAENLYKLASAGAGADKLVKDKPFSADALTETVQVLSDGNRIIRRNATKYFRDRAGRTRREQTIESLGPGKPTAAFELVFLSDPLTNIDSILDPAHQTARKFPRLEIDSRKSPADQQNLGTRKLEGLDCTGTRTTTTIPALAVGNEKPITIVTETWFAPAIEAIVHSNTKDPRFGESTYTLRHIVLADQPITLFEIPPGYKVEEPPPGAVMKRREP